MAGAFWGLFDKWGETKEQFTARMKDSATALNGGKTLDEARLKTLEQLHVGENIPAVKPLPKNYTKPQSWKKWWKKSWAKEGKDALGGAVTHGFKGAMWGGLIAAGAVAAGVVAMNMRNDRRLKPEDIENLPDPTLDADLPPVLDFSPPQAVLAQPATLMGEPLKEDGPLAMREMMKRGGGRRGPDVTPPSVEAANGASVIDGQPVQDLGAPGIRA